MKKHFIFSPAQRRLSARCALPLLLVAVFAVPAFGSLPHGVSNTAVLDTRVVARESDRQSNSTVLDTRAVVGMLAWGESPGAGMDTRQGTGAAIVIGTVPPVVNGVDGRQWVVIRGENFQPGAVVTLRVGTELYVIPQDRTRWISPTEIRVFVNLTSAEATWTVQVANPGWPPSESVAFSVGAPDVTPLGTLDFGTLHPGGTATRTFRVRNKSNVPVELNVSVGGPFQRHAFPPILQPGVEVDILVDYRPQAEGRHEQTVRFTFGSRSVTRVVAGTAAGERPGHGSVAGIVLLQTPDGLMQLPNATVILDSAMTRRIQITDGFGKYLFDSIPGGEYTVTASWSRGVINSHGVATGTVVVSPDQTTVEYLTLPLIEMPAMRPKEIPVLLVRGRGEAVSAKNMSYWQALREYLEANGFEVWDPGKGGASTINGETGIHANVPSLRDFVALRVEDYGQRHNGRKPHVINIVAHSMGGLITRQFLDLYRDEIYVYRTLPMVRNVIMLGTPQAGTILADDKVRTAGWGQPWQTDLDLKTKYMRTKFGARWPYGKGTSLFMAGGTSPGWSAMYMAGASWLGLRGPVGDGASDGAVPFLSSKGKYIEQNYPMLSALYYGTLGVQHVAEEITCFSPPANAIGHQEVSLNHTEIKEHISIRRWVRHILEGNTPVNVSAVPGGDPIAAAQPLHDDEVFPVENIQQFVFEVGQVTASNTVQQDFVIDAVPRTDFIVSLSTTSATLSLLGPSGQVIDEAFAAADSNATFEAFMDDGAASYMMRLTDPDPGDWSLVIDGTAVAENFEYRLHGSLQSSLELRVGQPDHVSRGLEAQILAAVGWEGANASASSVMVDIAAPSGTNTVLVLLDDGAHGDFDPEDGIFGGWFDDLGEEGEFQMVYRAAGLHPDSGQPYQRVVMETISVSASDSFIAGVDEVAAVYTDETGLANSIRVDVSFYADQEGDYRITGELWDDEKERWTRAAENIHVETNGMAFVSLIFDGREFPQGQMHGPFTVRNINLYRRSARNLWLGRLTAEEPVDAYLYNDFARRIRIVGDLDFGGVRMGTQEVRQVTLINDGWEPLTVGSIVLPEGFSGEFMDDVFPGQEVEVVVTFQPTAEGLYSGYLEVDCDAVAGEPFAALSGMGLPVAISYEAWADNANLPPGQDGPLDVLNPDNIPNLAAYVYNIDPIAGILAGDTNALPFWRLYANEAVPYLTVDYRINRHAVGFALGVEATPILVPDALWSNRVPAEVQSLGLDPVTGDPRYRAIVELGEDAEEYLRLKIGMEE